MVQGAAAEAIFFGGFDRQLGLLIRQMSARGLGTLVVGGDSICTPDMASYYAAGAARDGQIVCVLPGGLPDTVNPAVDRFAARLAKHFEFEAKFYGAYAYDAVMVLADAMARTGSSNPAQVLPSLAQRRNFQGLTGTISFDDRGNLVEPALSLFNYRGEQRQLLRGVP